MAAIFFFVALGLGGIALLFRNAHQQLYFGTPWAVDVCSASNLFCTHPEYLAYAGGIALVLALGAGLGRVFSGE